VLPGITTVLKRLVCCFLAFNLAFPAPLARWKQPIAYHFLLASTSVLYIVAHIQFLLLLVRKPAPLSTPRISDGSAHLRLDDFLPAIKQQQSQRPLTGAPSSDLQSRDSSRARAADVEEKVSG
jgi:hypothetical protein